MRILRSILPVLLIIVNLSIRAEINFDSTSDEMKYYLVETRIMRTLNLSPLNQYQGRSKIPFIKCLTPTDNKIFVNF